MVKIKHHFWKNKTWVMVSLETMIVGIIFLLRANQLDVHTPSFLSWTDDVIPALFYFVTGLILLINVLWDFWQHYIRLVLIVAEVFLWSMLTTSYAFSDVIMSHLTVTPFIFGMITINILLGAYLEPRYKMKGGASD